MCKWSWFFGLHCLLEHRVPSQSSRFKVLVVVVVVYKLIVETQNWYPSLANHILLHLFQTQIYRILHEYPWLTLLRLRLWHVNAAAGHGTQVFRLVCGWMSHWMLGQFQDFINWDAPSSVLAFWECLSQPGSDLMCSTLAFLFMAALRSLNWCQKASCVNVTIKGLILHHLGSWVMPSFLKWRYI